MKSNAKKLSDNSLASRPRVPKRVGLPARSPAILEPTPRIAAIAADRTPIPARHTGLDVAGCIVVRGRWGPEIEA